MKRIIAIIVSILLLFGLTACNGVSPNSIDKSDLITTFYEEIINSGNYYMEYNTTMKYEGKNTSFDVRLSQSGSNFGCDSAFAGKSVQYRELGASYYSIDMNNRKVYNLGSAQEIPGVIKLDLSSLTIKEIGSEKINGVDCTYERFDSGMGNICFYYSKEGMALTAIDVRYEGKTITLLVSIFSANINSTLLSYPVELEESFGGSIFGENTNPDNGEFDYKDTESSGDYYQNNDEFYNQ